MRTTMSLLIAVLLCSSNPISAQRISLSTNLLDYACLGTFNVEASYTLSRHWSLTAGARYNPFTFHKGDPDRQFQYRQQSYAVGARLWPWHSMSGWWFASKVRYQEYNKGGFLSRETEEGDRVGLGLYSGYTYMLSKHLNLEFGLGLWGCHSWYTSYSCPYCGLTVQRGRKWSVLPDDVMISFAYVF